MAVKVKVTLDPVDSSKVDAALARIQSKAKGVDFGGGARSIDKLSRPLGKITGQATEFQKSLEASNARVLAFGASVVVINKLSEAFGALVRNTIQVEATFAKIGIILGGTQKQLQDFGNGIFDVAKKTGTAFDDVAEGALELARQGLGVEESLSRVETALKLVRVAGIDSQKAVSGLTAAIKGFEGAGLTVAAIGDKLSEVDTKFAVSTEDLINGLERASASARVAGVSFDELLAVVTTVQERTQRGGAVIGNAFKTIFARLGRTDTLVAMEELGINVLDTEGNVRSAIPLFKELAGELNKLGLKSVEAGEIIQKVAGVRQRDILISLVEDLNSSQSQFSKALETSAGAAGALDSKNTSLNQTLEALINNLTVGGQKLASVLGEIGFTDSAKDILKLFSSVVSGITDLLQGDSVGAKFAQGIVKGIGGILTGPGLALIGAIFTKLFIDLTKFGAQSLTSLLGINKASQQQAALQQSVLQTLLQNENIQREILALEGNKVAQEQLLLKIYNQQAAALARVTKAAATVAPGLFAGGFRGGDKGVNRTGRGAGGYIAAESRDVSRGVGGAPSSAKVVSIPNFAFGGGKRGTMVANTSEYHVPNYAGGGDAIFNQDMVRTMGLPSGAKKINAAGGFIPNFVRPRLSIRKNPNVNTVEEARDAGYSSSQISQAFGAQNTRSKSRAASKKKADKLAINPSKFAMIVPSVTGLNVIKTGRKGSSNEGLSYTLVGYKGKSAVERGVSNDEQLDKSTEKFALDKAFSESKLISGNRPQSKRLGRLSNQGAISALSGAIFETAVSSLLKSDSFDTNPDPNARFDFLGGQGLDKLFSLPKGVTYIDAKIRNSPDMQKSMFGKIKKQLGRAANGYIPNFANGAALEEAIGREQAAGLPINQIRINQSGKLRNAQNPDGLAVTNTRDEPTGAIPNFASTGRSTPASSSESSGDFNGAVLAASTGLFFLSSAFSDAESGVGKFISEIAFAASALTSLTLLKGPLENVGSKISNFGLDLATRPKGGRVSGGLGRGIAGVGKALPAIGTAVAIGAVVAPLVLELTKTTTGFERLNKELDGVDLSALQLGETDDVKGFLDKLETDINSLNLNKKSAEDLGAKEGQTLDQRINELVQGLKNIPDAAKDPGEGGAFLRSIVALLGDEKGLTEIQKVIDKSRLTPEQFVDKRGAKRDAATGFGGFLNRASDKIFGGPDREFSIRSVEQDSKFNTGLLFDSKLFKESILEFAKSTDKVVASLSTSAEKQVTSGKFGKGAVTGGSAKKIFTEQLTDGRFAAAGFDTKTIGADGNEKTAPGLNTKIRAEELKLAKAIGTVEKVDLENKIALLQFSVDKKKEEFVITEAFVKSISDSAVFSKDALDFIESRVEAGGDLLSIQDELKIYGFAINEQAEKDLQLAVDKLKIKREEGKDKVKDLKLQREINDLQKPQGFSAGLGKGVAGLRDDIAFFKDELGENIPLQFSDNLGQALTDAVSGAKDIDEALSEAGRNFLGYIRDAFLQQAADQFTAGLFGGGQSGGGGLVGQAFEGVKNIFSPGQSSGAGATAATAASGAVGAATATQAKGGGIGGFISGLFSGGGGGGALGSSAANPMFVQDVSNMLGGLNPKQEGADAAASAVEGLTGAEGGKEGGIFSKITDKLGSVFGGLKDSFGEMFGGLKDSLGGVFKNLTSSLGSLFSGGAGGGGIGGMLSGLMGGMGGIFGGITSFFGFANGGPVGFANGGPVGSTDTVPAMLTPGEFVVKRSAVDKYGTDFLSSLNKGMLPMQGFQNGGSVSPVSSESGVGGLGGNQVNNTSDFTFNIQDGQAKQEGGANSNEDQREFASKIKSAVTSVIQEESRTGGSLNYLYK